MITLGTLPYIVALSFTALLLMITVGVYVYLKKHDYDSAYEDMLSELLSDDLDDMGMQELSEKTATKPNLLFRWNQFWATAMHDAGVGRYANNASDAGRDMAVIMTVIGIISAVVLRQPIMMILAPLVVGGGTAMFLRMRGNKQTETLTKQLPGLLFAIKANLQSGDTNERALMKVVDSMPEPLYSDLTVAKRILMANGTFREALEAMSAHTASRDLQFLSACMIQASQSGSNMAKQIDAIQGVLRSRQKVSDTINRAVKSVSPAVWISTIAIPGVFVASLLVDRGSQEFWFKTPLSWVILGIVIALYVAGLLLSKKQVDKIKNM